MPPNKRVKVSCRSCGLLTKIDTSDVLPPCSECGGTLVPMDAPLRAEPTPPPEPLAIKFCSACDASNPATARFCENCGESLAEREPGGADTGSPRRRRKVRSKSLEQRSANIQLGKAYRTMKRVRALFIVLATFYGLATAVLFLGLLGLQHEEVEVPGLYVFLLFYAACTFSVFVLGAVFLRRQPFAWTLSLACLMTVDVVLTTVSNLADGKFVLISIPWLWVFLTTACWTATASMLTAKRLLVEHGDTAAAQRFTGEAKDDTGRSSVQGRRAAVGEISSRARERSREGAGRSIQRVITYSVASVVAVVLVVVLDAMLANDGGDGASTVHAQDLIEAAAKRQQKEKSYEPVLNRFLSAWKASDKSAIAAMASPGSRQSILRRLEDSLTHYSLSTTELPEIQNRRDLWLDLSDGVKTYFSVPATSGRRIRAKLKLHWVLSEGEWILIEARLRGTTRDD